MQIVKIVPTPVVQFLADLNGGALESQIAHAISDVALGVNAVDKPGKVILTLDFKRVPNTSMVQVAAKMEFRVPTKGGTRREDTMSTTPLHVGTGGKVTAFPEKQTDFFMQEEKAKA